ncbi:hypothetical protein H112_02509 [Trichophyton rubrum D6]|uniref:Uncharacterized protein n=1 Tax=Trichophyton rubrum CBS 288.86 TaxID=1215330 RepID=A0A022W9N2_TRIRU|nr:hypothetical protein H100_02510 [Trichophyton rubrum MR850]EZF44194.1 hypothetical protein H102_02504 [Trichophyton rubrum CBS 100081]EZF54846.1 hypothetical protein H103_02517 [Trichophyton rubrum CBS 288.86]EZF65455.1 hypothetical protein H104_02495 [Trichophyton rubrum CBS 289.86]EZF86754.1 hypothetical protein H110_02514 [Trichophyton rubrum MR1448]EZG19070.1 hypothetical protein H107_02590 [Trichophyton rubrum CBS 202.88]KDB35936.1 hypothetical protein H112_02509 [Trichophyton rubrum 
MKKKTRTACATIQRWMYEEPAAWQDPMGCTADSQLPEWQLQVPSGAGRPPTLVSTRPEGPASLAGISLCYGDSVSFQGRRGSLISVGMPPWSMATPERHLFSRLSLRDAAYLVLGLTTANPKRQSSSKISTTLSGQAANASLMLREHRGKSCSPLAYWGTTQLKICFRIDQGPTHNCRPARFVVFTSAHNTRYPPGPPASDQ